MISKLKFPVGAVNRYAMLYPQKSNPLAALKARGAGLAIPGSIGYCQEFAEGSEHCAVTFIRQQNPCSIEYSVSLVGTSRECNDKVLEALIAVSRPSVLLVNEEKKLEPTRYSGLK